MIGALGRSVYKKHRFDREKYKRSINYLKQKQFIEVTKDGKINYLKPTKSGKAHAFRYYVDSLFIKKPKHWEGCGEWSLLTFQI